MTRLLTPTDYGIINLFNSYVSIFTVIFSLGAYTSVGRYYYEKKDDFKEFFGTAVIFTFLCICLSSFILIIFKEFFANLLKMNLNLITLLIPVIVIKVIDSFFTQIYQPQQKSKEIAMVQIIKSYSGFLITVFIILLLTKEKYLGQIYSNILTGLFASLYIIIKLKSYFKLSFNKKHFKYILNYSIPLLPYYLNTIILAQFDRIMINNYKGASDTGLYSFAYNIGMLVSLVITALNQAWMPEYFRCMDDKDYKKHDSDVRKIFNIVLIAAFGFTIYGKELGMILAPSSFHIALRVIPIIVLGYVFTAVFAIYSRNIGYSKKTIYSSIVVLTAGVINIVLNAIFIPIYGIIAAAITSAISYLIMSLLSWIISKYILKLYSTPIFIVLKPLFIFLIFAIGTWMLNYLHMILFVDIVVKFFILVLFTIIILWKDKKNIIANLLLLKKQ